MEEWAFIDDAELQGWKGACICMTCQHFHLRGGSALPHAAWLHAPAEAAATGPAPTEEVQAMGTHLAERDGMGS